MVQMINFLLCVFYYSFKEKTRSRGKGGTREFLLPSLPLGKASGGASTTAPAAQSLLPWSQLPVVNPCHGSAPTPWPRSLAPVNPLPTWVLPTLGVLAASCVDNL